MTEILTQSQPMVVRFDQAVGFTVSQYLFVRPVIQKTLVPGGVEASGVVVRTGFESATSGCRSTVWYHECTGFYNQRFMSTPA